MVQFKLPTASTKTDYLSTSCIGSTLRREEAVAYDPQSLVEPVREQTEE